MTLVHLPCLLGFLLNTLLIKSLAGQYFPGPKYNLNSSLQSHCLASFPGNRLVFDPLDLAAELYEGPVPPTQGDTLGTVKLTLRVEKWKELNTVHLGRGHHYPDEATQVLLC